MQQPNILTVLPVLPVLRAIRDPQLSAGWWPPKTEYHLPTIMPSFLAGGNEDQVFRLNLALAQNCVSGVSAL